MIQVSSRLVYENRWLSLREDRIRLPDGSPGIYSVVDKPTAALVIPMERGGCHLVEQYRYPIARRSWEFPQGTWSDGRSGAIEELARAELAEETGLRAGRLERIGQMAIAPGLTSQRCEVFLATDLTAGPSAREHTEQGMAQRWFAGAELVEMLGAGEIIDAITLAAFSLLIRRAPEFVDQSRKVGS
ncbi:MAG TPA: NUDIX hydrolase [Streptosporangiaceae bacterium]|nr:NUDIX hydrolase [Streptosporangiaceae bacterium]